MSLYRNIVVVGSTGAGKSRTCNTLFGTASQPNEPFVVAHDEVSSTKVIVQRFCEAKNINIIDTPSFGHNRINERQVNNALSKLSSVFSNPNSQQIDAFVLVVRFTPRAQTFKTDLEHLTHVFGKAGLKSTIILPIYSSKKISPENFLEKLEKMPEIAKLLKEAKQEEPSEDWYCLWDNINPREGQEEELLRKIAKLTPYTQNDFMKAQDQLNFYNELDLKDKPKKIEKKKEQIFDEQEDSKERLFSYSELQENINKVVEAMEIRQQSYKNRITDALKKNDEMLEKFMKRVEELEKKDKEEEKKKEMLKLVRDLACRKRRLGKQEKTELVGATITEGTQKTAEKTAISAGRKIGEEIGKQGAKQLQKQGNKIIGQLLH